MAKSGMIGQPSQGTPVTQIAAPTKGASGLGSVKGDGSYYDVRSHDAFEGSIRGKNKPSTWVETDIMHDVHQNTGKKIEP
jgi:hypothetical protein